MLGLLMLGLFIALLAMIHPFTTYPLSLKILRRLQRKPLRVAEAGARPSIAILVSAFNEERVIERKVEQLLATAAAYGPARIHIYVDGSRDRTAAILEPYTDRIDLIVSNERRGKTAGLKTLIARTGADLLVFTDANVDVPTETVITLAKTFDDPEVACAAPRLLYTDETGAAAKVSGAYWRIEEKIKALESETIGVIGVDGSMFMVRRDRYVAPPDHLIDDLYVSISALLDGGRVISLPKALIYEKSASQVGEEFRRKVRIAAQAMNVNAALWPRIKAAPPLLLYGYISHRLLKWFLPFSAALAGLFFVLLLANIFGLALTAALAVAGLGLFFLGVTLKLPLAMALVSALASLAGVARGVIEGLVQRRTYTVWEPAASVRDDAPDDQAVGSAKPSP